MPGMPEIAAEATPASALVTYQSNDDNLRSENGIVLVGAVPPRKAAITYPMFNNPQKNHIQINALARTRFFTDEYAR